MSFASQHRFNFSAFAFSVIATVALNGTMLVGFDQLASTSNNGSTQTIDLAKARSTSPAVTLERVVISTHRA